MPLGNIVDQNSDTSANDTWALVLSGVVINTIVSNVAGIQSIAPGYDYSVDLNVQGQQAGIGWTYNPNSDTFAAPSAPPTNWVEVVQDDFDSVATAIEQVLSDYQNGDLSLSDLANAYAASLSDGESAFSQNQLALMNSIYLYVQSGG